MMKNLYLITTPGTNEETINYLKASAEERSIKVREIYPDNFDFSQPYNLTKKDGLYRITTDKKSRLIEQFLINKNVATFHKSYLDCIGNLANTPVGSSLIHWKLGLPIIKTVFCLTKDRTLLNKYVAHLGGFPIIVKALGGSHGVGVMKIDSFDSLYSIVDFLLSTDSHFILRQYIDYTEHARLVVLGNKVVSSIEYKRVVGDFRTNVGNEMSVLSKNFGKKINTIAVKSVSSIGREFGGVDILIDKKKQPYIAEVNFPCYFPRAQEKTKVDISGLMIDHLIKKSKR